MLHEIFFWLFNMSITAAVTGGAVLLLRRIRWLPRRVVTVLWIIPLIRMWVPVGIGSPYGLMALISRFTTKTVPVFQDGHSALTMTNYTMAANSYFPIVYRVNLLEDVFQIGAVVWAILAAALLIAFVILYGLTTGALKDAGHLRGRVYQSDRIVTPAVYGIFRPRIILPTSYAGRDLTFVLLHENAHIRRADNLWRVIACVTAALHWFNPLVWVFLKCFLADLELACDETVLAKCGEEQKKSYALALVECAESKSVFASAFGGAKIRVRVENILSYRKLSVISGIGFSLLAAGIMYILLTNAA